MRRININSNNYFKLLKLLKNSNSKTAIEAIIDECCSYQERLEDDFAGIRTAKNNITQEIERFSRKSSPLSSMEEQSQDLAKYMPDIHGTSFISVLFNVTSAFMTISGSLIELMENCIPEEVNSFISEDNFKNPSLEQRQLLLMEMESNRDSIEKFVAALQLVSNIDASILEKFNDIANIVSRYYDYLQSKYSKDLKIFRDVIVTDIATAIYDNIDAHGEIESGKDTISAFTEAKAIELILFAKSEFIQEIINNSESFIKSIIDNMDKINSIASVFVDSVKNEAYTVRLLTNFKAKKITIGYELIKKNLMSSNPTSIIENTGGTFLTAEEKYSNQIRNETIEGIVNRLSDNSVSEKELLDYVLERKKVSRKQLLEENTFYVCKISTGNPFLGLAPGALQVMIAERPNSGIDKILGSGYDEVRAYLRGTDGAIKWHDLFLATNPRKKADRQHLLLIGPPGCHRKGQKILMFDGTLKCVEDIEVGNLLMGPDSQPRTVLELHRGTEEMVEIIPNKGNSWVVNKSHILSLIGNRDAYKNKIKDVSISDYIKWSNNKKRAHLLFRVKVNFQPLKEALPLDPYFLGILLGDGSIKNKLAVTNSDQTIIDEVYFQAKIYGLNVYVDKKYTSSATYYLSGTPGILNPITDILRKMSLDGCTSGTKFIPNQYKLASENDRLQILAGLLDTDGYSGLNCFDYISKSEQLANDVVFISRSLGLAAYIKPCKKKSQNGTVGDYFRVSISGDTDKIPVRISYKKCQKRKQIKNVLRTSFKIKNLPKDEYFGFSIDKDHRYLLDDFTVTHNCGKSEVLRAVATEKDSIAIFAQGSDFLTCWKGEDQKNPKRLFEQAIKIQKQSKKHVYIMIDEIDSVLNNAKTYGETNLTLEFQILMDGIVSYPNISVWGTTNFPEKIPMAMLRRFKSIIVGELSKEDIVKLLKYYVGTFLPHNISYNGWERAAEKLSGSTGDVIAKIAESLWRDKLVSFITANKSAAVKLTDFLNQEKPFNIREFDDKSRNNFIQELKKYVCIEEKDLFSNIDSALKTIGIRTEIDAAVATYANVRKFMTQVENQKNG